MLCGDGRLLNQLYLMALVTSLGLYAGCSRQAKSNNNSVTELPNSSERARQVSDGLASDLINDRRKEMRAAVANEFRSAVDERQFGSIVDQIVESYGRPIEFEFK